MKFELKQNNRNSSDEDLISDLISVAEKLNKKFLTREEYTKHGRYSDGTLSKRFGGWLNALKKAGLPTRRDSYTMGGEYFTDEQLINELKRINNLPEVKILSVPTFDKHKKIQAKKGVFAYRFGSWSEALKRAGIEITPSQSRYSDEDLFENLLNVWTHHGRQPTVTEMGEYPSKITRNTYSNRFGNWQKALEAFVEKMNKEEDEDEQISKNEIVETTIREKVKKQGVSIEDRRNIGLGLRYKVLSRDNFKCVRCGRSPATEHNVELHIDHKLPFSRGGKTILENLQTLCKKCNLGKGNRHFE